MQATMQPNINPSKAQKSFSLSLNHYLLLLAGHLISILEPRIRIKHASEKYHP
jgi:hypothetical protein